MRIKEDLKTTTTQKYDALEAWHANQGAMTQNSLVLAMNGKDI